MSFAMFHDLVPDVADQETRTITVMKGNEYNLPPDDYALIEMYCNDRNCDCRKVFLVVISRKLGDAVARISYAWESLDYYANWFFGKNSSYVSLSKEDKEMVRENAGTHLAEIGPQSKIASAILRLVKETVLRDSRYVERIKRHYRMFRDKVEERYREKAAAGGTSTNRNISVDEKGTIRRTKIGRNDPCPCGSGKKYKKCCINNPNSPFYKFADEDDDIFVEEDDDDIIIEEDDDDDIFIEDYNNLSDEERKYLESTNSIFDLLPEMNRASKANPLVKKSSSRRGKNKDEAQLLLGLVTNLRGYMLKSKAHIKKYNATRKLHSEVIDSMVNYFDNGSFKPNAMPTEMFKDMEHDRSNLSKVSLDFDMNDDVGALSFYDIMIYKHTLEMGCITEEYINKGKFRKPEKIEFLDCMLNSVTGLFEVVKIDTEDAYVYLKDVFTGEQYKIVDIALSGPVGNSKDIYMFTRIITYQDISFGTGLVFLFRKKDPFIIQYIAKNKGDFTDEIKRYRMFFDLYTRYTTDRNGVRFQMNKI